MEKTFTTLALFLATALSAEFTSSRSFTVDYERDAFMKDGVPFRYISGCMHYFRIPRCYWMDRLIKMKACGLDAVETYIPWNFHWQGSGYNFSGQRDIVEFLNKVHEAGLVAILRGLPFSDTEWDMGGLPYWLLRTEYNPPEHRMVMRSSDPKFMSAVKSWLAVLLPLLEPLLYNNGGPIIMIQVENEYGSYHVHDESYLKNLYAEIHSHLKGNVVLFTTDGNNANDLKYGHIDGALQTVDFGPGSNVNSSFTVLRKYQPDGPIANSEFYTGWLDHWGESHHRTSAKAICNTFDEMLSLGASVNFYMFVGGTNFEYWAGSNSPTFRQITTSYDYDSPISENGDTTYKYFQIRETISKYKTLPPIPVPANISTTNYGKLEVANQGTFWDYLSALSRDGPIKSANPLSFEDILTAGGYVLYRVVVPTLTKEYKQKVFTLIVENKVRDYAQIFINQSYVGSLDRDINKTIKLGQVASGSQIDLLVESQGRVCYGSQINDSKGIDGVVKLTTEGLNDVPLRDWEMYPLRLENLAALDFKNNRPKQNHFRNVPAIFVNTIYTPEIADTFLDFSGGNWTSGYVLANGFNLGKFMPMKGPQKTLYLPTKAIMNDEPTIKVVVFETRPNEVCSTLGHGCTIDFIDHTKLG